jgi:hypothetical protein
VAVGKEPLPTAREDGSQQRISEKKIKNNLCRLPGSRAVGKVFLKKIKKNNFLKKNNRPL